jgi:hypothetical protein
MSLIAAASSLLIILLSFNATGRENVTIISNVPAQIGSMEIVKNIVISNSDKQETISASEGDGSYLSLIETVLCHHESFLSWPYSRCSGQGRFHTCCKSHLFDLIFDFIKTAAHHAAGIDNPQTLMRDSGGGEPIVFDPITKSYFRKGPIRRGGLIAISSFVRQPEAAKDGANIGAELPLSGIARYIGLPTGSMSSPPRLLYTAYVSNENERGYNSISESGKRSESRPPAYLAAVLGCFALCGFVLSCVGLEGSGHPPYLVGGWIIAVASGGMLIWWWV